METYDVLVASYVYFLFHTFNPDLIEEDEVRDTLKGILETHGLSFRKRKWRDMMMELLKYERRLRRILRSLEDEEKREVLTIWHTLTLILIGVTYVREEHWEEALKVLKKARRMALSMEYVEPYVLTLALQSAVLYRLNRNTKRLLEEIDAYLDEVDDMHLMATLLEGLAYLSADLSSDRAFAYTVEYALTVREADEEDAAFYFERINELMETVITRLLYEMRAGKVLGEEVEWVERANTLFDWMEKALEDEAINTAVMNLYVKFLQYATLRFNRSKADPLNLGERLKRTDLKLRKILGNLLFKIKMIGKDDEKGRYDDILKA